jgi:DNA-binding XRE family transcriptional regulator
MAVITLKIRHVGNLARGFTRLAVTVAGDARLEAVLVIQEVPGLNAVMANVEDSLAALGAALHEAREKQRWTVEDLAEKCGLSASAIAAFESGQAEATLLDVVALAKALGTTPQQLFANAAL